jgi:hypothetical protein
VKGSAQDGSHGLAGHRIRTKGTDRAPRCERLGDIHLAIAILS